MRCVKIIALVGLFSIGSLAGAKDNACPKWEAGTRYPWQSSEILPGDQYATVILDVDRKGYPFRCTIGKNNYPDREFGIWICRAYYLLWRGPEAAASDPDTRRLERFSLIDGSKHDLADRRARRLWFEQHPDERPACYPEPSRPDRMDL
jgi:hypothetical protein